MPAQVYFFLPRVTFCVEAASDWGGVSLSKYVSCFGGGHGLASSQSKVSCDGLSPSGKFFNYLIQNSKSSAMPNAVFFPGRIDSGGIVSWRQR